MLSVPIIATTTCADFRCALGRFVGCTYRPRLLPGAAGRQSPRPPDAGAQTDLSSCVLGCANVPIPLRRTVPRGCNSKVFTPSMSFAQSGMGSAPSRSAKKAGLLRRCRIRFTLRTACLLDPKRAFVMTLQRSGSLLALATSYTAAWPLPWPDSHRQVEHTLRTHPPYNHHPEANENPRNHRTKRSWLFSRRRGATGIPSPRPNTVVTRQDNPRPLGRGRPTLPTMAV